MARILILGNNPDKVWIKQIVGGSLLPVPDIPAGKSLDVVNFILSLQKDVDFLVIDADSLSVENLELPLDIALNVRLMLYDCLKTSLSHIVLVSDFNMGVFKGYGAKSMLLMTQAVSLVNSEEVNDLLDNSSPLTPGEYVEGFLNLIKIVPAEKIEGRHSIANEWGASILNDTISKGVKSSLIPVKTSASLYFKYSSVVALNAEDVNRIISGKSNKFLTDNLIIEHPLNYLLIDDEADKGWEKVLSKFMPNASCDVCNHPCANFEDLPEDIRTKIGEGEYDVIFLDLRMAGVAEEKIVNPEDFSGMKILRSIKKLNRGTQVIMLTATNKAWNVKALLDAGADGYYMKEAPEYHFSLAYSEQNTKAFRETILKCIDNAYLQDLILQVKTLQLPEDSEISDLIRNQLDIALSLILKAKTYSEFAFAYISLEQIFEIASSSLIQKILKGNRLEYRFTEDTQEECRFVDESGSYRPLESMLGEKNIAQWKMVSSIYFQLYDGQQADFSEKVRKAIALRNQYIHPGNSERPRITAVDFQDLFDIIMQFLSVFK